MFKRIVREAIEIFCQVPILITSSPRSIGPFCRVIYNINHVTKCPNPSLDKNSAMKSKACVS